ncbi:hypothetical protein NU09_1649 [Flavobacterium beibuense]|uniref:Uncharacterized protein n=1 Tax=Flavobacterium beibuense TaxID=657326 RepID=A0A444WBU4_9FLAO|nr:hypothetical protein NU09_1649 [Flavobacterium beibuense]
MLHKRQSIVNLFVECFLRLPTVNFVKFEDWYAFLKYLYSLLCKNI